MLQARSVLSSSPRLPWDDRVFVFGTYHKGGSTMMVNIVERAFKALGADMDVDSCFRGGFLKNITECMRNNVTSIRLFTGFFCPRDLEETKAIQKPRGARTVMEIRDPRDMMVSAYCFAKSGGDYGVQIFPLHAEKIPFPEILTMGPAEGLRVISQQMFGLLDCMNRSQQKVRDDPDVLVVRYEDFARSSRDFDKRVLQMFHFLFEDLVSPAQYRDMWEAVKVEDLNRQEESGNTNITEHTNDDECMRRSTAVLRALPDINAKVRDFQRSLGYA